MTESEVRGLFMLAGFNIERLKRLPNAYLGDIEPLTDEQVCIDRPGALGMTRIRDTETSGVVRSWMSDYRWRYTKPAWFVRTQFGWIEIGWRKRVIEIEWIETPYRGVVTSDDVTKHLSLVHAWSIEKALEYLRTLRQALEAATAVDAVDPSAADPGKLTPRENTV